MWHFHGRGTPTGSGIRRIYFNGYKLISIQIILQIVLSLAQQYVVSFLHTSLLSTDKVLFCCLRPAHWVPATIFSHSYLHCRCDIAGLLFGARAPTSSLSSVCGLLYPEIIHP